MEFSDIKCTKSICEKYTLRFNNEWDWAIFTIDEFGLFNCQSSYGDYSYHWSSFGKSFKEFLCRINSGYLLDKIAKEDYFDFDEYIKKCKQEIVKLRRDDELNKEQARELWGFFNEDLDDYSNSTDLIWSELYSNKIINDLYNGEVHYSEFAPSLDYSHQAVTFANKIFPMFTDILKKEIENINN